MIIEMIMIEMMMIIEMIEFQMKMLLRVMLVLIGGLQEDFLTY